MIIAIDGTASSGKSTIAKTLANSLSIPILNTGAIYRAITLKMINFNVDYNNIALVKQTLNSTIINTYECNNQLLIEVDSFTQDPKQLNSPEVSALTPKFACLEFVRDFVRNIQRTQALNYKNIIVEGRDIGSVVFPNAEAKFFIDADLQTRATRRLQDYIKQGKQKTLDEVVFDLKTRDDEDKYRHHSPLIMTHDSILLDTSNLTIEESVNKMITKLKEKGLQI